MEDLFKAWLTQTHPDVWIDNEERTYRLMFSAYQEGYEEGKVAKADDSFLDMLGNDDCGDACKI